jgi:hypothetical protein
MDLGKEKNLYLSIATTQNYLKLIDPSFRPTAIATNSNVPFIFNTPFGKI